MRVMVEHTFEMGMELSALPMRVTTSAFGWVCVRCSVMRCVADDHHGWDWTLIRRVQ